MTSPETSSEIGPEISVVIPCRNEVANIGALIDEIEAALGRGEAFEVVIVDDRSTDGTGELVQRLRATRPWLRLVRIGGEHGGQSRATRAGAKTARGRLLVTLDGDGQNDPADIPKLLEAWRDPANPPGLGLVTGERRKRRDTLSKRLTSRVGNGLRQWALRDGVRDTGCSLKLFERDLFLDLPFFDHMHRFLPALVRREGLAIRIVPVGHRPRGGGRSNYGFFDRAAVAFRDLMGVMWLKARCRPAAVEEVPAPGPADRGTAPP